MNNYTVTYTVIGGTKYEKSIKAIDPFEAAEKFEAQYFGCTILNVKIQPVKIGFWSKIKEYFYCPFYF